MYIDALRKLGVWFHVPEYTNYGCWIPVHLREIVELSTTHSEIAQEFRAENFTVQKTKRTSSAIPVAQAHEQYNAAIKGDRGPVGLTDNIRAPRQNQSLPGSSNSSMMKLTWETDHKTRSTITSQQVNILVS